MANCNSDESSERPIPNASKKRKSCSLSGFPLGVETTGNLSASGSSIDHEGQNFDNRLSSVKLQQKALVECLHASPFHVVILYEKNFDQLSEPDFEHVETTLKTIIRMTILQKGEVMRFETTYRSESGWLSLICADKNTVNWILKQKISDHNGKRFKIIRKAEIPNNLSIVMKVPTKCMDIAQILEVLSFQNDGLFIDEWKVFKKCTMKGKNNECYTRIAATIPPKAIPFLHQIDWKPYYEFSRAVIISNVPLYGTVENQMLRPRKGPIFLSGKAQKSLDSDVLSLISDESEPEVIKGENNRSITSVCRKNTNQPPKKKNQNHRIKEENNEECTIKREVSDSRESNQNPVVSLISDDEERDEEVTVKPEPVDNIVQKDILLISDDDEEEGNRKCSVETNMQMEIFDLLEDMISNKK